MPIYDPLNSDYTSQLFSAIGRKLYLNSEQADVHFVIESDDDIERVSAHKAHLIAGSDVFATMFNGTWKEKDEVIITDTTVAAFKQFLQFFYVGEIKLTLENIDAVMKLGDKYNVDECLSVCSKFLANNLNDDNVCQSYALAILYHLQELRLSCETVIGFNANAVFQTAGFLTCNKEVLIEILKLNWMSCTEAELFEACMSWVKSRGEENDLTSDRVRAQLGNSFNEFRFGSMSLQEFATLIQKYEQFLIVTEYNDIIQSIADKEFESKIFNGNRVRRCDSNTPWHGKDEIECYRLISQYNLTLPYFVKDLETIKFSVNGPLMLKSFTLDFIWEYRVNQYKKCGSIPSDVNIVEISGSKDSEKESIQYIGKTELSSSSIPEVVLTKPILIRPGLMYEIRLKQTPPENCAIGTLLKSEVEMKCGITVQFHDDPLIPKDISRTGLIFRLNFYGIGK